MMPAPKRTASDSFASSQQLVVKRQKSDANLSNGSAVSVVGNNAQNGALIQSVCTPSLEAKQHLQLNQSMKAG